jgi:hypothetical protein
MGGYVTCDGARGRANVAYTLAAMETYFGETHVQTSWSLAWLGLVF